ncbi:LOW QUALITY PROTEIN: putative nuclease HARBI1 [Diorhabda carinulata]|uniref:LOW QUALITY PROTEIN: putative nuclease HARBI1 n=1 Tax=Diorhabda carinulata TaxID=1163345 RepID=UPI0025A2E4AE|nr:LOW QUALITY PROTEIN: putative nuclease HARBI1 [Diorhabda carinulata]
MIKKVMFVFCFGIFIKMEIEDQIILDNDYDVMDIINDGFPRARPQRPNYFDSIDDLGFFRRFRLTKPTAKALLGEIQHTMEFDNNLNNQVSPMNQLLTTLRFYASNGHQIGIGDLMGIHQTTACRIISRVSRTIAMLRPNYIQMPENHAQLLHTQQEFYHRARFPRVVGCIDCTHIKINSPGGEDPEIFRNRKGIFSINTQVVGNANLEITDIVARWPGSVHDATIFNNSSILARLENQEFGNGIILGDSGYALRPFLLTPLLNPVNQAEQRYNESLIRTRNCIERLFGCWKRRFPVLAYGMRCHTDNVMAIIVATAVLHNICRRMGEDLPPAPEDIDEDMLEYLIEQDNVPHVPFVNNVNNILNYRQQIINTYFARLN